MAVINWGEVKLRSELEWDGEDGSWVGVGKGIGNA